MVVYLKQNRSNTERLSIQRRKMGNKKGAHIHGELGGDCRCGCDSLPLCLVVERPAPPGSGLPLLLKAIRPLEEG